MAYSINDKVYSDHALMDEITYHTKKILKDIVIKNRKVADSYETKESVEESNVYMAILDDDIDIYTFPFTEAMLMEYGYDKYDARKYVSDVESIPDDEKDDLLTWACVKYLNEYEEKNFYYRMLNGLPKYGTDEYNVYIDPSDSRLEEDDCNTDFIWTDSDGNRVPIHEYPTDHINTLETLGILDDLIEEHKGDINYNYLSYLTLRNIPIYQARKADEWDILYIPKVEYLVRSRFSELYYINRQIYYRNFNQIAFTFNQDYFEELTIVIIVSQTLADMVVDIPEWYIRRDIFDLRSCKYFLDSQGVKFFKQIPLKYQIRIVKNINKLIRYKSTNKNMKDIINLFNADDDVTVYKYYLLRDWIGRYKVDPEPEEIEWEMEDEYDFLDEENSEEPLEPGDDILDFGYEDEDNIDFSNGYYLYNFGYVGGYMDPDTITNVSKEPTAIYWEMEDEYDYGYDDEDNILADRTEDDNFGYMNQDSFSFGKGAYYYDFLYETTELDEAEFDFYDEEEDEEIATITADAVILDFWDEDADGIFQPKNAPKYDFGNMDGDVVSHLDETLAKIEAEEAEKVILDEYKNLYSLEFIKVPIGDNYDNYIKDNMYRVDYDTITLADKYWDGEDSHSYVKNLHMEKDFTVEGTKYMGIEYDIDMQKYQAQIPYFLGMIFQSTTEIGDIRIELPMVGSGSFTLTDIFIFLQCIAAAFYGRVQQVHLPDYIGDYKPSYKDYPIDIDGGHAWTIDSDPPEPEPEVIEDVWVMPNLDFGYDDDDVLNELIPDELNFGYEDEDDIITPDIYDQYEYDFDWIDPEDPDGEPENWDYGYYFNTPDIDYEYTFEDDEDYDFIFEIPDDEDVYDIQKTYDFNTTYTVSDRDAIDEVDERGNSISYTETLYKPEDETQFIPEDLDMGEEDDEVWNLPQASNLYGVNVIDFGYHSNVSSDPDVWDYGITYSYIEYIVEHKEDEEAEIGQWYPWSDLEEEYYTLDIDGNPNDIVYRYGYEVDGGKDGWSIITHETFYDWLRWDNPQQFISESNRIYGFNLQADLTELEENIGVRHSNFGFERGYTLEDLGIADFISVNEIDNVNDLLEIYTTNINCYWNLREIMEYPNSRDEFVTAKYAFMYLFTKPFDQEFYRLKTGDIASNLPEILRERSLALYKYYNKLLEEEDTDSRQDFIRATLNDISNILEYYIKGDNLKYVLEWIPTYSFSAIVDYINLMITFFKSWKVYMLDPIVVYDIKDKVDNRTIIADQMASIKETKQIYDLDEFRDVMTSITETVTFEESNGSYCQEVIDGYSHFYHDPNYPIEYDGGYYDTEVEEEAIEDDMDYLETDLDGGDISSESTAKYNVDGGQVGARLFLTDIDGGGPMELISDPIDINGKDITEDEGPTIVDNSFKEYPIMIDGGGPGANIFYTKSCIVTVEKQVVRSDIRISDYKNNVLEVRDDGLYLYGDPEMYGFEYYGEDIPEEYLSIYDYGEVPDYPDDAFIPPDIDFGYEDEDTIDGDPLSVAYDFTYHADLDGDKTDYDYNFIEMTLDDSSAYDIDLGDEDSDEEYDYSTDSLDFGYIADDTERYEYFKRIFYADKANYTDEIKDYYTTVMVMSDPNYVTNYSRTYLSTYFVNSLAFIKDMTNNTSKNKMIAYIDDKADELTDWVNELSPLGWKDF